MPAILVVPPTEFVTENVELRQQWQNEARAWREEQKRSLGLTGAPREVVTWGAFRGTEVFDANSSEPRVLYTALLFPRGSRATAPFLRLGALLRQRDCLCLGSTWKATGLALAGFPESLRRPVASLDKIATRPLDFQSTFRFDVRFNGVGGDRFEQVLHLVAAERFAAGGLPVISSLGRIACDAVLKLPTPVPAGVTTTPAAILNLGPGVSESGYPSRAHRVVEGKLILQGDLSEKSWPGAMGRLFLVSGLFGDPKGTSVEVSEKGPFDPVKVAEVAFGRLAPLSHKLSDQGFRVTRREGRFVTLDRGRAYGLEIGTHLVSRSSKLHVVQYSPWEEGVDAAVALIRAEPKDAPLKAGDTVTFDPTQFPAGRSGAAPIPLAPPK